MSVITCIVVCIKVCYNAFALRHLFIFKNFTISAGMEMLDPPPLLLGQCPPLLLPLLLLRPTGLAPPPLFQLLLLLQLQCCLLLSFEPAGLPLLLLLQLLCCLHLLLKVAGLPLLPPLLHAPVEVQRLDASSSTPAPAHPHRASTGTSQAKRRATEPDSKGEWQDISVEDEEPFQFPFSPQRTPGVQLDVTKEYSPLELFQLFFSKEAIEVLCEDTNKNAQHTQLQGKRKQ